MLRPRLRLHLSRISHSPAQRAFFSASTRRLTSSTNTSPHANANTSSRTRRIGLTALVGISVLGSSAYILLRTRPIHADSDSNSTPTDADNNNNNNPTSTSTSSPLRTSKTPLPVLLRSYLVFTMCSFPTLVDYSPTILATLSTIPGLKQVTEAFVRATFFSHFVGGETALDTLPVLANMRKENKGTLFAYCVEVNEDEAVGTSSSSNSNSGSGKANTSTGTSGSVLPLPPHKLAVEEMIRCIDVAADFEDNLRKTSSDESEGTGVREKKVKGRRTWVAIKLSALVPDGQSLVRLSSYLIHSRQPSPTSIPIPIAFPGCPRPSDLSVLYSPATPTIMTPGQGSLALSSSSSDLTLNSNSNSNKELGSGSEMGLGLGSGPGSLTSEDVKALRELKDDLFRICQRAKERGVRVIVDAEYSWYQPAIDAFQLAMMREFNRLPGPAPSSSSPISKYSPSSSSQPRSFIHRLGSLFLPNNSNLKSTSDEIDEREGSVQPLVYGTFQAYLRRNEHFLTQSLLDARAGGYALGVKLVRGAYHPLESSAHAQMIRERESVNDGLHHQQSLQQQQQQQQQQLTTKQGQNKKPHAKTATTMSPAISPDQDPPVWTTKEDTDACYARCLRVLMGAVEADVQVFGHLNSNFNSHLNPNSNSGVGVGALFGTHNEGSCELILEELVARGLATLETADSDTNTNGSIPESGTGTVFGSKTVKVRIGDEVAERVSIGQLYGMNDSLTDSLVARVRTKDPFVIKYVPYGALTEVMPYLGRRATENKSILGNGQAEEERRKAAREIWGRVCGWFGLA